MKNLYKTIKSWLCVLLTAAILCTNMGMNAFAAEEVEQNTLAEAMEKTSLEDISANDTPSEEVWEDEEATEEIEKSEENTNEENPEGGETGEDFVTEDPAPEETPDGEEEEIIEDISSEEEFTTEEENDIEDVKIQAEDLEEVSETSEDGIIASGEYKEDGNDITWEIDADGKLTVEGTGDFLRTLNYYGLPVAPWYDQRLSVKSAEVNVTGMTDASAMFYDCKNLTSLDVGNFDTSNVKYMDSMCVSCNSLESLDVGNFDTSNVTDMSRMFDECSNLKNLDLSNFNTGNVTNMSRMFDECSSLGNLDVGNFDTSNVTDMWRMFGSCSSMESLDVSKFDTKNVEEMASMFSGCSSLENLDLSNFNTGNVTDMGWMFSGCSGLKSLDVSNFNTSNVDYMSNMFFGCSSLESLDLSNFDTNQVYSMDEMFVGCTSLTSLHTPYNVKCQSALLKSASTDIWTDEAGNEYEWLPNDLDYSVLLTKKSKSAAGNDITWAIDADGKLIVEGTGDFSSASDENRAPWYGQSRFIKSAEINITGMTDASYMFYGCDHMTSLEISKFDTSNVTNMDEMFSSCSNLESLDLSNFDTSNAISMGSMFSGCNSLESLDLNNFDTSNVTDMGSMFAYCSSLKSLDLSNFDTRNVTSMGSMFSDCSSLESLDLSSFDTSNVKYMWYMFDYCSNMKSLDLSNFDTSNVMYMHGMFRECNSMKSLDLSNFNSSNVTDMSQMFNDCSSMKSLDLSNFDSNKVRNMEEMFDGCISLASLNTPYNVNCRVSLPKLVSTDIWFDEAENKYEELPQSLDQSILLTKFSSESIILSGKNVIIKFSEIYDYVYDGQPKTPKVTVTCMINNRRVTLEEETDYIITYENNINAFENNTDVETAQDAPKIIISGRNQYTGIVSKAFSIQKAPTPEDQEQTVYIEDYNIAQEGCTLDLSGCFADYSDKIGYAVGTPIEDDTIPGNVLSGELSIDEKGVLVYNTAAGTKGDFVDIPVVVSFTNHKDAMINVKIIMEHESDQIETVFVPTAFPESGRQLTADSEITLACETPGAEIYYMTSENKKELAEPVTNGVKYTTPIKVSKDIYIRAVAIKGANRSKLIDFHYTIAGVEDKVLKPYASPEQGVVENGTKVELKSDTPNAEIYYITGGNADMLGAVPVDDEHKYTKPIEITKDMAIKAIAKKDGMEDSDFSVFVYRINFAMSAPAAYPAAGTMDRGSYIALNAESDVNIYYTMDRSDPVTSGSARLYESRIRVDSDPGSDIVIKAAAEKKGIYSETVTFTYTVSESTVKGLQVMLAGSEEFIYTGSAITPAVIVTNNGEELVEGEDYTVRYSNNIKAADQSANKAPKITVTGKGNLTKSRSITFTIKPKDIGDEEAVVGGDIVVVSGKTAAPILYYDGVKLTAKDFVNPNAKKRYVDDETITITGKGNFEGTRDIDVRVVDQKDMKKFTVAIDSKALKSEPLVYDGEEKTMDGYFEVYDTADKSSPLEEYSDYAVIYPKNNINAGKVKFTVVGLGKYYGTVTKSYTIKPRAIKTETDGYMDVNVNNGDEYSFTSGGVTIPGLIVTCDGDVLALGKDYKVTYSNNKKICSDNKAKCTISFKGNYKGSKPLVRKFNITAAVMDDVDQINESVSIAVADKVYTGKPGAYKSIPYVTVNGVLLKSSDYKVSYYKDVDREQVIDGKTASSSVNLTDRDKQTVYMKIEGKGNYEGTLTAEYNVYKLAEDAIDLSKAKITIVGGNKAEYTGEGVSPAIEVKYKSGREWKVVDPDDIGTYVTVTYINNVNKGKAIVMITGNGDRYVGSKTAIFSIVPKSMK